MDKSSISNDRLKWPRRNGRLRRARLRPQRHERLRRARLRPQRQERLRRAGNKKDRRTPERRASKRLGNVKQGSNGKLDNSRPRNGRLRPVRPGLLRPELASVLEAWLCW